MNSLSVITGQFYLARDSPNTGQFGYRTNLYFNVGIFKNNFFVEQVCNSKVIVFSQFFSICTRKCYFITPCSIFPTILYLVLRKRHLDHVGLEPGSPALQAIPQPLGQLLFIIRLSDFLDKEKLRVEIIWLYYKHLLLIGIMEKNNRSLTCSHSKENTGETVSKNNSASSFILDKNSLKWRLVFFNVWGKMAPDSISRE